jgi:hypothetical protein
MERSTGRRFLLSGGGREREGGGGSITKIH